MTMIIDETQVTTPVQHTTYLTGRDILSSLHTLPVWTKGVYDRILILSDHTVFPLYQKKIEESLSHMGIPHTISLIPPGETSKRLPMVLEATKPFFLSGLSRKSLLLAIGGGMITDLGGFIGSILLRGIDTWYISTTVLGQVDAAIGGKTGVDIWIDQAHMYKNMLGTIRQPRAVISDTSLLSSLPLREIRNGLGEIVKYWIGWRIPSIQDIHKITSLVREKHPDLVAIIHECQNIKKDIITKDPYELHGKRAMLNLGHTIGHGIEASCDGKYAHGECVAIGCVAASIISCEMGMLTDARKEEIHKTIASLGLPTGCPGVSIEKIKEKMKIDKKGGTFVLIRDIGSLVTGVHVPDDVISSCLTILTGTS